MTEASRGSPAHRLRRLAGALLVLSLLLQVSPGAAGPKQTKRELEAARKRAEQLTDRLKGAQRERDDLRAEIHQITLRISLLTAEVETLQQAIAEVKREKKRATKEIRRLQGDLDDRARTAYINGPGTVLELVLESDSLIQLSDRLGFLQVLQREDADLAEGIRTEKAALEEFVGNLDEYRAEKEVLLAELQPQQQTLEGLYAEQEALIAGIQEDRKEALRLVQRLEEKYKAQLQAALAASSAPVGGGGPPVSADGPLYWCPVDPPRSYVDTFGAPRSGGRTHEGQDMFAPYGTPIRAPFAGMASEQLDGLGGITVIVEAPNGDHVYNAHMSRFAGVDGRQVRAGDLIGYVGNSGNAAGTSPHDHFEYWPGGGSPVNPYAYMNEVCGVNGAGF
jgi:murein DD-endopeptidase MepM/ murein hydrolase activator NlpD